MMEDPNDLGPETACPKGTEDIHCNCWYDGSKCHFCGDPAVLEDKEIYG